MYQLIRPAALYFCCIQTILRSNQKEFSMRSVKPFLFLLITFLPSLASALGLTELIEGALNYHPSIIQQKELQSASLKGLDSAK